MFNSFFNRFFDSTGRDWRNFNLYRLLKRLLCLLGLGFATVGSGHATVPPMAEERAALEKRVNQVRQVLQAQAENSPEERREQATGSTVAQWPNWPNWGNYFRNY